MTTTIARGKKKDDKKTKALGHTFRSHNLFDVCVLRCTIIRHKGLVMLSLTNHFYSTPLPAQPASREGKR